MPEERTEIKNIFIFFTQVYEQTEVKRFISDWWELKSTILLNSKIKETKKG